MGRPSACLLFLGLAVLPQTAVAATLTISSSATEGVSCSGGVCNATAAEAVLNATQLENMLSSGGATVQTEPGQNLVVAAPITWSNANSLTLDASANLQFGSLVDVEGAASVQREWHTPRGVMRAHAPDRKRGRRLRRPRCSHAATRRDYGRRAESSGSVQAQTS